MKNARPMFVLNVLTKFLIRDWWNRTSETKQTMDNIATYIFFLYHFKSNFPSTNAAKSIDLGLK